MKKMFSELSQRTQNVTEESLNMHRFLSIDNNTDEGIFYLHFYNVRSKEIVHSKSLGTKSRKVKLEHQPYWSTFIFS